MAFMKAPQWRIAAGLQWNSYLHSFLLQCEKCFLFIWNVVNVTATWNIFLPLGEVLGCCYNQKRSHSITYLCDNITVEKPSKQSCSQTKPAASTAKCSLEGIVFQLLVASFVHVQYLSFLTVMQLNFNFTGVMIYWWSDKTASSSFNYLTLKIKCYFKRWSWYIAIKRTTSC